jgi:hypothetical protein
MREKEGSKTEQCAYLKCCYLADSLDCYGYKSDCVLYKKSNNLFFARKSFDDAVDRLIDKTKAKYDLLEPRNL